MLSKMCIIFTVATAGLLVGPRSAAADCSYNNGCSPGCKPGNPWPKDGEGRACQYSTTSYLTSRFCYTCTAEQLYFTDAEEASVTTTATGAKCYDHKYRGETEVWPFKTICACDPWGALGTCTLTWAGDTNKCPYFAAPVVAGEKVFYTEPRTGFTHTFTGCAARSSGTCCTAPPACTAGANGASCQNGGTAFGTGNNCGCNCATGYEGANCQLKTAKACTGHVGWGSIRHYSAHESPCNRDVFVGKLNEGEGYYWSTYPNGAGWCRSISREGVTGLKKQLESRINWVHLFGAESEYGRTYFPPTPTTTCVPPANGAQFLKAGDEEEAQLPFANVVDADADPTAATTTTNTQPTPAEVARTVFAGIIAACGLYVVWVVARKTPPSNSNKDVLDAPENMAEISEI